MRYCTSDRWYIRDNVLVINGNNPIFDCNIDFPEIIFERIILNEGIVEIGQNDPLIAPFAKSLGIKNVVLPNTLKIIHNSAFANCTNLEIINFPNNLLVIGNYAFLNCNLVSVTLNSVQNLSVGCFMKCSSLAILVIRSPLLTAIPYKAFYKCPLHYITLPISIKTIDPDAFFWKNYIYDDGPFIELSLSNINNSDIEFVLLSNVVNPSLSQFFPYLSEVRFNNHIRRIGNNLFEGCKHLSTIIFNNINIEEIGNFAFYKCERLKTIKLPPSLISIGDFAFAYCSQLLDVYINGQLNYIGDLSFSYCTDLKRFHYCSSIPPKYGADVFLQSYNLESVSVPLIYRSSHFAQKAIILKIPSEKTFDKTVDIINPSRSPCINTFNITTAIINPTNIADLSVKNAFSFFPKIILGFMIIAIAFLIIFLLKAILCDQIRKDRKDEDLLIKSDQDFWGSNESVLG